MRMRLVVLFIVVSAGFRVCGAKEPGLPPSVLVENATSRLIELTAHVTLTNDSASDVQKYLFRLTTPPGDLPYQRSRLLPPFADAALKTHKNGVDRFLELKLALPAKKAVAKEIKFLVLLSPADYLQVSQLPVQEAERAALQDYLRPSVLVESAAPEIKALSASLVGPESSELQKVKAAYEYPARVLKFCPQEPAGAVKALQTGRGDCTEYASLFCALCRASGVPARRASVFNLGSNLEIAVKQPNHDIAEVFLATHGWCPVDANVGGGKYDRPVGLAKAGHAQIMLKREGSWVWSSSIPSDGVVPDKPKPAIQVAVSWHAKVLQEGRSSDLASAFSNRRQ